MTTKLRTLNRILEIDADNCYKVWGLNKCIACMVAIETAPQKLKS